MRKRRTKGAQCVCARESTTVARTGIGTAARNFIGRSGRDMPAHCGMMLRGLDVIACRSRLAISSCLTSIGKSCWHGPASRYGGRGRYLVADLLHPHHVLSTSARNGGRAEHVRHLVNHQSCEGAGHEARARDHARAGAGARITTRCAREIDLPADATAMMGTAANMNYAASWPKQRRRRRAWPAVVTAGVQTNAVCAGDPASWRETPEGIAKVAGGGRHDQHDAPGEHAGHAGRAGADRRSP